MKFNWILGVLVTGLCGNVNAEEIIEAKWNNPIQSDSLKITSPEAVFSNHEGDSSNQQIMLVLEYSKIINNNSIETEYRLEPKKLADYVSIKREVQDLNGTFEDAKNSTTLYPGIPRKLRLTYNGKYSQSQNLSGQLILETVSKGDKISAKYEVTIKKFTPNPEGRLRESIQDLQSEVSQLRQPLDQIRSNQSSRFLGIHQVWIQTIIIIGFFLVIIYISYQQHQRNYIRILKKKSGNRRRDNLPDSQNDKLDYVTKQSQNLETKFMQVKTPKNRELEKDKKLIATLQEDNQKLNHKNNTLTKKMEGDQHQICQLKNDLSTYKDNDTIQLLVSVLEKEKSGIDKINMWLKNELDADHNQEPENLTPIHSRNVIKQHAIKFFNLISEILETRENAFKEMIDKNRELKDHEKFENRIKELNKYFQKEYENQYGEELFLLADYIETDKLPDSPRLKKVFIVGGIKQSEQGALQNLNKYFRSTFYPLISRSIVSLQELSIIDKFPEWSIVHSDSQNINSKIADLIQETNNQLNIQMKQVPLLEIYQDDHKRFCKNAGEKDMEKYKYQERSWFYDAMDLKPGNIKAVLYIGYTIGEAPIGEEQRTRVVVEQ